MADLIPGMGGGLNSLSNAATIASTVIGYVALALVTVGAVYLIYWLMYNKILKFNIPVTLKYEEGGGIRVKRDMIWIKRSGTKWEVQFQKNIKLIAPLPDDRCAFVEKGKKAFEGFVRNNQVAWTIPTPITEQRMFKGYQAEVDGNGEMKKDEEGNIIPAKDSSGNLIPIYEDVNLFQILPANMVEAYMNRLFQNRELLLKKKFWQDPVVLQWGAMILFFVAVIFIYLMCKNIPDLVNGYLAFAKTVASGCQSVRIT